MKQVSVETIFGTGTHHPCLSTLGREIATSGTVHSTQYPWIERDLQPEPERAAAGKRRSDGCEWRTMDEHPSGSWSTIRIQDAEGRCVLGETCSFWPVLTRSGSTGGERLSCLGRLEPCGGARRWQTAAEIRCFRQKLHGRASRLPCSRPRSVCGYMLPRGRLEGGQTRVPGRSGVTRRECSDHRVTVNLSRPSAAKDGSESMCLVRARHHLEASGFCRGPGNSGSDGDIRRSMRFRAGRLPVSCNLARRHNFRETHCLR
jgi:hypothetical protein